MQWLAMGFLVLTPASALMHRHTPDWGLYFFVLAFASLSTLVIDRHLKRRYRMTVSSDEAGYTVRVDWIAGRSPLFADPPRDHHPAG
jgi:hypothetical protein